MGFEYYCSVLVMLFYVIYNAKLQIHSSVRSSKKFTSNKIKEKQQTLDIFYFTLII